MKIAIATPFYEIKAYSPYIKSLISSIERLNEAGIGYEYLELRGDPYVERAKNSLADQFLKSNCTHIFMIDSDLSWEVDGFMKIIEIAKKGAEIVMGVFRTKGDTARYPVYPRRDKDGYFMGKEDLGLIQSTSLLGGFTVYSRQALERVIPHVGTYRDISMGEGAVGIDFHEFFKSRIRGDGERQGEDFYMGERFQEAGGTIWIEPNIDITHWGIKGYKGNYHKHLLNKKALSEIGVNK